MYIYKVLDLIEGEQLGLDGLVIIEDGKYFVLQFRNDQVSVLWNIEMGELMYMLGEGFSGRNMVVILLKSMLVVISYESFKVWEIQSGKMFYDFVFMDIDKIYFNYDGIIVIIIDFKGY